MVGPVEEDLAGLSSSRLNDSSGAVAGEFDVEEFGQPGPEAVGTAAEQPGIQADLDLQVHYGVEAVRAWEDLEWFANFKFEPADSLFVGNFDRFGVNGFA